MTTLRKLTLATLTATAFGLSAPAAFAQETPVVSGEGTPAAEEEESTPGWFRLDTDGLSTQFWVGATHDLGGFQLASDIYVVGAEAELDLGPSITIGDALTLIPMAGIVFNFEQKAIATAVAPQLFTYLTLGPVYFESWAQFFFKSPFGDDDDPATPENEEGQDTFYTRNFLLYNVVDGFGLGPHMEATIALNDSAKVGDKSLTSLVLGGALQLEYGKSNILLLALGYDTQDEAEGSDHIAGRFTFVRTW